MKRETLILSLIICVFYSLADGSRYMKDEYRDGFEREYDDGSRFAVNQTRDLEKSHIGKINESENDEIDLPKSDPPAKNLNEDDDNSPPGRGSPQRGPHGRGPHGRGSHRKGPPRRGPPNFDEDGYSDDNEDRYGNYGRGPPNRESRRRGRPNFDDDYNNKNYGNGPPRRDRSDYNNSGNGGRNDEGENEQLRRGSIGRNNYK